MSNVFRARCIEGNLIKILSELLAHNIKTGCFEIDINGITLCTVDHDKEVLIHLHLPATNLSPYIFNPNTNLRYYDPTTDKLYVGLTTSHLYRMLSSVKKKDIIELFIDDTTPMNLNVRTLVKDEKRNSVYGTTASVAIQAIRELQPELPENYSYNISIPTNKFQQMLKLNLKLSKKIQVIATSQKISFSCEQEGIASRTDDFDDMFMDETKEEVEVFREEYLTERLSRISKISGLNKYTKVYPTLPLLIRTEIGNDMKIGVIDFYIKSIREIENDKIDDDMTYEEEVV